MFAGLVVNVPEFWMNKGSKYASDFENARILKKQTSDYIRVTQDLEYAYNS